MGTLLTQRTNFDNGHWAPESLGWECAENRCPLAPERAAKREEHAVAEQFSALLFAPMGGSVKTIETRSLLSRSEGAAMPVADIMACQHVDPVGMVILRGLFF